MKINKDILIIIKNTIYSVSSNFFTLLVSVVVTLIAPKFLGVEEYSYWQLYLFYVSYSGYLHLGWNDGFLLRNSGHNYQEIDKSKIKTQFTFEFFFLLLISVFLLLFYFNSNIAINRFIFIAFCLNVLIVNIRYFLMCLFQCTSRFADFSFVIISERFCFVLLLSLLFLFKFQDYRTLVIVDLMGKIISIIFALFRLKDMLQCKIAITLSFFKDILENIKVGIKIMLSSLSNMLILGIARFRIERFWDIIVFGKVSLSISIVNLFVTFVNAIGIIVFQQLFRIKEKYLITLYILMKNTLILFMGGILMFYFPVYYLLSRWIPVYADSLILMSYLFPMCIFESKMVLLNTPFLKMYRFENYLLSVNTGAVLFSLLFTFLTVDIVHSIPYTLIAITIISFLKCAITDYILQKKMQSKFNSYNEFIITIIFIFCASLKNMWHGFILYFMLYTLFLYINREKIYMLKSYLQNIAFSDETKSSTF